MNNNFQRLFYILKNMDSGVGYPTGYIKVEINCEIAKIQVSLNNLLNRQGVLYKLYGISKTGNNLSYTVICDIPYMNGRADIKINVDSLKAGTNKLSLDNINIFAVILSEIPNKITPIKCPLVAYKKGELEWKTQLEAVIISEEIQNNKTISEINENYGTVDDNKTDKFSDVQFNDKQVVPAYIDRFEDINNVVDVFEDIQNQDVEVTEDMTSSAIDVFEDMRKEEADVIEEAQSQEVESQEDMKTDKTNHSEYIQNSENEVEGIQATDSLEGIPTADVVEQNIFSEHSITENDILSSAQKNFRDISSIDIDGETKKTELSIVSLKEELDKSFEVYNPFNMRNKSFKWWKINSPGFLNNILFRNNVKTYLLFNPKVMLAHYKYRYIIFGIRNDKHSGKEYLICGIPAVYSIDENPFGNMGSWAQIEGYKPKYGAFGYWIILIDPRTGKLLKIK